jgi:hypothetical protein
VTEEINSVASDATEYISQSNFLLCCDIRRYSFLCGSCNNKIFIFTISISIIYIYYHHKIYIIIILIMVLIFITITINIIIFFKKRLNG